MIINDLKQLQVLPSGMAIKYGNAAMKMNKSAIMLVMLIIYFPICILNGFVAVAADNINATLDLSLILSSPDLIEKFLISPEYLELIKYNIIGLIIDGVLVPFGTMAVVYIVKEAMKDRIVSYKEALSYAFERGPRFILSMIVYSICVFILTMLGIIPGVILSILWYFYVYAIIIDNCEGIKSLGRSRELVSGRMFKTLIYMIVFYCMNYLASYVLGMLFGGSEVSFFTYVVVGTILCFINMILTAGRTAVYIYFKYNKVDKKGKEITNKQEEA